MLSYAFQTLRSENYQEIDSESFENIHDLFAEILIKGVSQQLKRGLYRIYVPYQDSLLTVRGKINIQDTIQNKLQHRKVIACDFDELSANNRYNQIIKTTLELLFKQPSVKPSRKIAIKRLLMSMASVDSINPFNVRRDMFKIHRNNQSYTMLLQICYFVLDGMLLSKERGRFKLAEYIDDQELSKLFEKFVLSYYQRHHKKIKASAAQIQWAVDEDFTQGLPRMQTDITLQKGEKVLIIDTKFYGQSMQEHQLYNVRTLKSEHLYQIYAYVKNRDRQGTGNVSGMLLYAKTKEAITPNQSFMIQGSRISAQTLDLNVDFVDICQQLDSIVNTHFSDNLP